MTKSSPVLRRTVTRPLLGILLASFSFLGFSLLDTSAKLIEVYFAIPFIIWVRFTVHGILTGLFSLTLDRAHWQTKSIRLQLGRGLFLTLTTACNFVALQYLPLATIAAIYFCSPIFSCAMAPLVLKEHVGIRRWTAVGIGLIGMLVIVRPGSDSFQWALMISLGSAFSFSFYTLLTRRATMIDSQITNFLYTPWFGIVVFFPFAIANWQIPDQLWVQGLLLSLGVIGCISHITYLLALRYAEASLLAPFHYQQIIYMVALGWIVFHDWPDKWVFIGAGIIVLSGIYILYRGQQKAETIDENA